MKDNGFAQFVQSHPNVHAYDDDGELKAEFKRLGTVFLKRLAKDIPLLESKVSYNAGGIAVSGDFHFRGMFEESSGFDLFFNLDHICPWITYRATTGMRDYHAGRNRHLPLDFHNPSRIIEALEGLR